MLLFYDSKLEGIIKEKISKKLQQDKKEDPAIRCKFCEYNITTKDSIISINGSHDHTFTNPSGIKFHIGCFNKATGCQNAGNATYDCTWFPEYNWCFTLCSNCLTHLGWYYKSKTDNSFYGLILERLIIHK